MSFPLAKLNRNDLISVLTKMEFNSFRNIRQASPWLTDFMNKNKVKLRLPWITIRPDGFCHYHMGGASFPKEDLEFIRPINILFYESCLNIILSVDYSQFKGLQHVKFLFMEEEDVSATFDKLYKENIPPSTLLFVNNWYHKTPHEQRNCFLKHPILKEIRDIDIHNFECPSPDFSFLYTDHGEVKLRVSSIPDISVVIRAIQMISEGKIGTKLNDFMLENKDIPSINAVLKGLPWKFVWSGKEHETSCLKDRKLKSFPNNNYTFWSIPVAEGKVGGLAADVNGERLIFKVFDDEEEYINAIVSGWNFYYYSSYS